jgi:hypothetical protein
MMGMLYVVHPDERCCQIIDKLLIVFHTKRLVGAGKRFVFASANFRAPSPSLISSDPWLNASAIFSVSSSKNSASI